MSKGRAVLSMVKYDVKKSKFIPVSQIILFSTYLAVWHGGLSVGTSIVTQISSICQFFESRLPIHIDGQRRLQSQSTFDFIGI